MVRLARDQRVRDEACVESDLGRHEQAGLLEHEHTAGVQRPCPRRQGGQPLSKRTTSTRTDSFTLLVARWTALPAARPFTLGIDVRASFSAFVSFLGAISER